MNTALRIRFLRVLFLLAGVCALICWDPAADLRERSAAATGLSSSGPLLAVETFDDWAQPVLAQQGPRLPDPGRNEDLSSGQMDARQGELPVLSPPFPIPPLWLVRVGHTRNPAQAGPLPSWRGFIFFSLPPPGPLC